MLSLLPGSFKHRVVVAATVRSISQIELFNHFLYLKLTTHHENYPSYTNQTCGTLLEKLGRTHK